MVYVCVTQKTIMPTTDIVSASIASVLSEMESISSLKEKQKSTLRAFLDGKDVFTLLPTATERV